MFFIAFGFTENDATRERIDYGIGGTCVALGFGLVVSGAVLWGVHAKRLDRLDMGTEKLELGPGFALRRRNLHLEPRGLGLRLAF